jgi:HSP20 family molecular chaperone IbpA
MEKIPTAKEFYLKNKFPTSFEQKRDEVELWFKCDGHAKEDVQIMIEFAKLHVEAAIKECIESAPSGSSTDTVSYKDVVYALKDCYPLTNIK